MLVRVGDASLRKDRGLPDNALLWLDGLAFGDIVGTCREGRGKEVLNVGNLDGEGLRMARGIGIDVGDAIVVPLAGICLMSTYCPTVDFSK